MLEEPITFGPRTNEVDHFDNNVYVFHHLDLKYDLYLDFKIHRKFTKTQHFEIFLKTLSFYKFYAVR